MARFFQFQAKTDPVVQTPPVLEDSWHQAWSEPVRTKIAPKLAIALIASGLFAPLQVDPPVIPTVPISTTSISSQVVYKNRFIYQAKAEPVIVAEVISEDKWHYPWSEPVRSRRFSAAQQDVVADVAFVPAAVSTAVAAFAPVDVNVQYSVRTQYQAIAQPVLVPTPVFSEDQWHQPWSEPVRTRKLATAQQQVFATDTDPVVSFGWIDKLSEPVRSRKFPAAQQDVSADNYFIAEIVTVDKWFAPLTDPVRKRIFAVTQQDPVADSPSQVVSFSWFNNLSDPVRLRRFNTALQDSVADVAFVEDTTFEPKWHQPWSEPVRFRRLATAQQSTTVLGVPTFEVVTEDKWHYPWSEPVRQKPGLATRYQQVYASGYASDSSTFLQGYVPWADPVRAKPKVSYQQDLIWSGFTPATEVNSEDKWHQPWSEPVRQKRGLGVANQAALFWNNFTPAPVVVVTVAPTQSIDVNVQYQVRIQYQSQAYPIFFTAEIITVDKWVYPWSEPVRSKPGLSARQQQFSASVPFVEDTTLEPKWHQAWADPARFRRLAAAQKQWLAWEPVFVTETIFEDKWHFPWSEPVRKKPGLEARYQQALVQVPTPPIVFFSYYNWLAEPVRLKKGLPTYEQQTLAYSFSKPIVSFGYYGWLAEPVRLKKGLRADEQQAFVGPPLFPNLPTTIPWFARLEEPVRQKKGLWASLQQFFGLGTPPISGPPVTVVIAATETNTDAASFMVSVYNRPVRSIVSIKEIQVANNAVASIEEEQSKNAAIVSIEKRT